MIALEGPAHTSVHVSVEEVQAFSDERKAIVPAVSTFGPVAAMTFVFNNQHGYIYDINGASMANDAVGLSILIEQARQSFAKPPQVKT